MTNTDVNRIAHADLGMPRVRMSSLRALPMTDDAVVASDVRATGIAVATGSFPGAHAWSPPG